MKKLAFILIAILVCNVMYAQQKLVLTLDSAKHYALEYNKTLIKSGLSIEVAQAQLWQTISQGLPQINGKVEYNDPLGYKVDFGGMQLESGASSNATVTATQLIFSGSYWVGINLSKAARQITETQKVRSELEVKQTVTTAFYNVLMAEEAKGIVERNLANIEDMYKKTEAMFKAGVAEETDVDQLLIQVMTLENTVKSTERNVELAYNMLRLQLGVGATTELELLGTLDKATAAFDINTALNNTMELDNNIDYQLVKQQIEINKKQVNLQKWSYAPTISGYYNYTYKIKTPGVDMTPTHTIGLTANVPLFSSGDRYKKVAEAKINLKSAQVDAENVADQLTIQEKQLRFNLQNAYDLYVTQQKNVTISRKVFNSMKVKYEQGVISSLDLTTANTNYLQAENNYLSAMLGLVQAQAELEKLLGTL